MTPDILSTPQIREWDQFTLQRQGLAGWELMDRAAHALVEHWKRQHPQYTRVLICCGKGGNGGDGMAMGRILAAQGYGVTIWLCEHLDAQSDTEFQLNRLSDSAHVALLSAETTPDRGCYDTLIDALRGSGTRRPAEGHLRSCIEWVNQSGLSVCSIDLPSGMPGHEPFTGEWAIVRADLTLCLDPIKLNLLLPESGPWRGRVARIPFGLDTGYQPSTTLAFVNRAPELAGLLPNRPRFLHKGSAGHALLIAGSAAYPGAAWLCAEACARGGAGRTTLATTDTVWNRPPSHLGEVLGLPTGATIPTAFPGPVGYHSVAVGPGIGTAAATADAFGSFLDKAVQSNTRLLLDADAINLLSIHPAWQDRVPRGSILTPHPAEFDRLTGVHASSWERLAAMQQLSIDRHWVVVLKNAFTLISDPEGRLYLTARGNTALAKAGSGDMLTGLMAAILARGTESLDAARVATWLLGRAAECATLPDAEEGLLQTDVLHQLPRAFTDLRSLSGSDEFFGYF